MADVKTKNYKLTSLDDAIATLKLENRMGRIFGEKMLLALSIIGDRTGHHLNIGPVIRNVNNNVIISAKKVLYKNWNKLGSDIGYTGSYINSLCSNAVSYTHLTLPTICSV